MHCPAQLTLAEQTDNREILHTYISHSQLWTSTPALTHGGGGAVPASHAECVYRANRYSYGTLASENRHLQMTRKEAVHRC